MTRFHRYRLFWTVYLVTLVLDQLTKLAVLTWIPDSYSHPPIVVIPDFFNLVHVYNKGAAFSMFSGYGWFLVLLAVGALGAIFFWRRALELEKPLVQCAFGLLTGGILGNVIDRVAYGHVVDFLDFNLPLYGRIVNFLFDWPVNSHWPAFNVADSGICIGVVLYLYYSFRRPREDEKTTPGETEKPQE